MTQNSPLENDPAFKKLDPRKKKILLSLVKEGQGKPASSWMPSIMKANQQLQQQGLSLTKEESTLLVQSLMKNLSPDEQSRFQRMQAMMNNMKR